MKKRDDSVPRVDYQCFENLIAQLKAGGFDHAAEKVDFMLHRTAWTTGSELLGELGAEVLRFQAGTIGVPRELQSTLSECISMVRRVWPDIR